MEKQNIADINRCNFLKSVLSEDLVRWKLQEEGVVVVKTTRTGVNHTPFLNLKFMERVIFNKYLGDKEEIIKLLKENIKGLPDFICLKGNKIFFVEVKSNGSGFNDNQKKAISNLMRKGFEVNLRNVIMDFNFKSIEEISVHKLMNGNFEEKL